jgi:hypothetical protein
MNTTKSSKGPDLEVFKTLAVRREGAVLFAEIAAPPMNLLGQELVHDLVSLIQRTCAPHVCFLTQSGQRQRHFPILRGRYGPSGNFSRNLAQNIPVRLSTSLPSVHDPHLISDPAPPTIT